jgi:hypothetical protein
MKKAGIIWVGITLAQLFVLGCIIGVQLIYFCNEKTLAGPISSLVSSQVHGQRKFGGKGISLTQWNDRTTNNQK